MFVGELNDFLPEARRGLEIKYEFDGHPSIKDAIEAIGVPHPEIDIIVANGVSVDFNYGLQDGDTILVFPVSKGSDTSVIHLLATPPSPIRFVIDGHLGKLARRLRMLGFDCAYSNNYIDKRIIDISSSEQRIVLTRDRGLLKRKEVHLGYWVRSKDAREQMKEVMDHWSLQKEAKPFSRCLKCNGQIVSISKEEVLEKLLPITKEYYEEFYVCLSCQSVYWKGSHYSRMVKECKWICG